ncbi:hypothetical protein [Variovorax paradoxus]|jgi:hypothetical protein|uniref:hypothetical protein n=1 Tax=Variovorax paradoxus TaxID=34073 RepID=UPI0033976125
MIYFFKDEAGEQQMRQTLFEPVVYMDHWAVRQFSEDKPLRDRFIAALHRSGGTLLVSLHNFGEFSGVSDTEQAIAAEEFFDLALPRMFVADFGADPGFIQLHGRSTEDGKRENLILLELARRWLDNGNKLTMAGLISDSDENRAIVRSALEELQIGIAKAVGSVKSDPEKVAFANIDKRALGATLRDLVMNALLRDFVVDEKAVFGEHDSSDFVHAFGAVMSANLVLLDGRWAHIVNGAEKRLKKMGVTHRLPRAFPKRELAQFLAALEAYPEDTGNKKAKPIPE